MDPKKYLVEVESLLNLWTRPGPPSQPIRILYLEAGYMMMAS
jgi:hypothetical protein